MVLTLEALLTDRADVFALITVGEAMFGQGTGVVESFLARGTLDESFRRRHLSLGLPTFTFGFGSTISGRFNRMSPFTNPCRR